ncbi:MAG: TIGR02594 family protein [Sphingomonas pseudosanguinis]|uniref:TIGR02594 family protein n=1 Tax=Sphingomonas pseudosanguinis TaxID=413712 RepID=UPI00391D43E6
MTLKTSFIITGDSSGATKAVNDLKGGVGELATASRGTAAATRDLANAQQNVASTAQQTVQAEAGVAKAFDQAATAARGFTGAQTQQATAARAAAAANDNLYRSVGQQKAGMFQLGQNLQDVGVQVSMGTDLMRVMAMQGGQLATAIDMIGVKGAGGRLAAFLAGPYGAVVLTATAILGPMAAKLWETGEAQDNAKDKALSLTDALSKQHFGTEAATKAIEAYNDAQKKARDSTDLSKQSSLDDAKAKLKQALDTRTAAQAVLAKAKADAEAAMGPSIGDPEGGVGVAATAAQLRANAVQKMLDEGAKQIAMVEQTIRNLNIEIGTKQGEAAADKIKGINRDYDLERQRAEKAAESNNKLAASIGKTVEAIEKRRAAALAEERERQADERRKPRQVSVGNQVDRDQAGQLLITAQRYTGLSEKNVSDRGELRQFLSTVTRDVDPKMTAWCAAFVNAVLATNGLKGTGSLSARSFLGYGEATDTPNKGDIVVTRRGNDPTKGHVGFYDGTDARGRIRVLGGNTGDKVGVSTYARTDVLGFRRAPSAAQSYKEEEKAAADALKEYQKSLDDVTKRYLPAKEAAKNYADELARIDTLAKGYDEKKADSGLSPEDATAARTALKKAYDARVKDLAMTPEAKAAEEAKKQIDGVIASLGQELTARQALDPVQVKMAQHQAELAKLTGEERAQREASLHGLYAQEEALKAVEDATRAAAQAQAQFRDMALNAFDAIVLRGEKAGDTFKRLASLVASAATEAALFGTGPLAALLKKLPTGTPPIAGTGGLSAVTGPGAGAAGTIALELVGKAAGKESGKSVGDILDRVLGGKSGLGKIIQGAGFGVTAASLTGGNQIGGGLGGAAGGFAASKLLTGLLGSAAGPIGSIVGGILGGVVGNLFNKPKTGFAAITSVDANAVLSGNKDVTAALSGSAKSIQSGIQKIADQLGGGVGAFSVSIGKREDHFRVDGNGSNRVTAKHPGSGLLYNGTDEAAAITAAIANAIVDGAVTGLSARVQQALQSKPDIDQALAEAVKVQNLELTMGGITAQIEKAFKDFEAQAADRVRIANAYGFDVLAIEKRNGEDRVKLAQQLAKSQVGGLQKLIEEMTSGSMFEGTAMDRIKAINEQIAKAKADLEAGVEGAGDTLANLYQQKIAASKDAYGTTSAYAADRTATIDEARNLITQSNARIAAASGGTVSDPALKTTNAGIAATNSALDENNDQNARMLAALERSNELLAAIANNNDYSPNLRDLAQRAAV